MGAAITYTYANGQVSHFTVKRTDTVCFRDKSRSTLIGVFCKTCPFYHGMQRDDDGRTFVICTSNFHQQDDEGGREIRYRLYTEIKNNAIRAFYD